MAFQIMRIPLMSLNTSDISSNRKSRKFFHGARTAVTDFGTLIVPLLLTARLVMVVSCKKIKRQVMLMPLTPIWTRKKNLVPTHLLPKSSRKSGTSLICTRSVLTKLVLFLTVNTYQHASQLSTCQSKSRR